MVRLEYLSIDEGCALSHLLTADDQEFISTITAKRRGSELTAWRSLLRQTLRSMGLDRESQFNIAYNSLGAPYLVGSELFISVSHSRYLVAVVISDVQCAVDIESLDRDFGRVAPRYVTEQERSLFAQSAIPQQLHLPIIWCAKEALYKLAGRRGVDLLADLSIVNVDEGLVGAVREGSETRFVELKWLHVESHIVVYVTTRN